MCARVCACAVTHLPASLSLCHTLFSKGMKYVVDSCLHQHYRLQVHEHCDWWEKSSNKFCILLLNMIIEIDNKTLQLWWASEFQHLVCTITFHYIELLLQFYCVSACLRSILIHSCPDNAELSSRKQCTKRWYAAEARSQIVTYNGASTQYVSQLPKDPLCMPSLLISLFLPSPTSLFPFHLNTLPSNKAFNWERTSI